jgi:Protein of unknown function (DUF3108)
LKHVGRATVRTLAGLMLCFSAILPAAELRPFSARYTVVWHGLTAGESNVDLQRLPDGRWSYTSRNEAHGLFRFAVPKGSSSRSVFSIRDGKVLPDHFSEGDGTDAEERDSDLQFDWVRARATGFSEKRKVDLPLQPGMLDSMTVQVALMLELMAGRTPDRIAMIDKDKIKEYHYTQVRSETLQTALGSRQTVLFRSSRTGSDSSTWFWCAPDLGYLPVKVERHGGNSVEWSMTLLASTLGSEP